MPFFEIILAGIPATVQSSGISLITTLPAPIVTLLPIVMPPITVAFAPINTLSPIIGLIRLPLLLCFPLPITTPGKTVKFLPAL